MRTPKSPCWNGDRNHLRIDAAAGPGSCCSLLWVRLAGRPWEEKAPSIPGVKTDVLWDFPAAPPSSLELVGSIKNINKMVLVYSGCPLTANPAKKGLAALYWAVKSIWRECAKGKQKWGFFGLILWRVARKGQKCGLWALLFKLFICLEVSNTKMSLNTGFFWKLTGMLSAFLKHRKQCPCVLVWELGLVIAEPSLFADERSQHRLLLKTI